MIYSLKNRVLLFVGYAVAIGIHGQLLKYELIDIITNTIITSSLVLFGFYLFIKEMRNKIKVKKDKEQAKIKQGNPKQPWE